MVDTLGIRPLLLFENGKFFSGNRQNIAEYELKIWEMFMAKPRCINPRSPMRSRLKIAIYTDDGAMSPPEKESINWESEIGIGGTLVISRDVDQFPFLEIDDEIPIG